MLPRGYRRGFRNRSDYRTNNNSYNNRPQYSRNSFDTNSVNEMIENHSNNANVLLLSLQSEKTFLSVVADDRKLKGSDDSYEFLRAILRALAMVCNSDQDILLPFITRVCATDFHQPIQNYLMRFPSLVISGSLRNSGASHVDAFHNLAKFIHQLQSMIPQSSRQKVKLILLNLNDALVTSNKRADIIKQPTIDLINAIKTDNERALNVIDLDDKATIVEKMHALLRPPNDFREMSIYPTHEDIHGSQTPFLRTNIIKGKYLNVDHYLDVQFRLLREDYVRPLREGIASYLNAIKNNKKVTKLKDVRVYSDVHILRSKLSGELLFAAQFDSSKLSHVNWQMSKRLIYGSMLCLSADNFQTFCFATVAGDRNLSELLHGLVWIKFETQTANEEFAKINPLLSLTMIESDAYFEAYRYNLQALQNFNSENFPLQRQLIEASQEIRDLPYLDATAVYNLTDLAYPLVKISGEKFASIKAEYKENKIESILSLCETLKSKTKFDANQVKLLEKVLVLDNDNTSWPKPEALSFDESQFEAFKAALTKQMVIIQGPPGTGKTYIGLRIVQTLLRNSKYWNGVESNTLVNRFNKQNWRERNASKNLLFKESSHKPIFVVCYTNHALDQFLEGMVPFCRDIVRIGGRSKSEILDSFTLFNLKSKLRDNRSMPEPLFISIRESKSELESIQRDLSELQEYIEQFSKRLISMKELMMLSNNGHRIWTQLFKYYGNDQNFAIVQWLAEKSNVDLTNVETIPVRPVGREELTDEKEVQKLIESRVMDDEERDSENANMKTIDDFLPCYDDIDDRFSVKLSKKLKSKILWLMRHELRSGDIMSDKEVFRVRIILKLSHIDRWRLYRYWVQILCRSTKSNIQRLQRRYAIEMKSYNKLKLEEDLCVIRGCDVIGMTTTGAAKFRSIIEQIDPSIVVIEEAAEVLKSHVITSLTKSTNHLILIGDHKQLKPNPNVYELAKKFKFDVSLFERMINNGMPYYQLKVQHRMRPCISSLLVPHFYKELRNHNSVLLYKNINGISKNMFFLNHNESESYYSDSMSKFNIFEAEYIVKLCKYIIEQNYKPSQITIIVMYSAQLFQVKSLMKEHQSILDGVQVTVVDNYQGEENDIILVSFVRSNDEGSIGFLQVSNRVNVALSRAKMAMYCIGNFDCLAEQSELWKNIVKDLNEEKAIATHLELICQNHPDFVTPASKASDFNEVPDGGCNKRCDFRLNCGHVCPKSCHPYDPEHYIIKCPKICDKPYDDCEHKCNNTCHYSEECQPCRVRVTKLMPHCGHEMGMKCSDKPSDIACTKICDKPYDNCEHKCTDVCHFSDIYGFRQSCKPCTVVVTKSMTKCGHEMMMKCFDEPIDIKCTNPCELTLSCDHKCTDICGNTCDALKCVKPIEYLAECSHLVNILCYQKYNEEIVMKYCNEYCGALLKCGHECFGTCGQCHQNRLHIKCEMNCERVLVCGHQCTHVCGDNCPPCEEKCQNQCNHSRCERKCGEQCEPCLKPCEWKCDHKQCNGYCYEKCDRAMCLKRCQRKLKCGHNCIGICGEYCPKICRICHKEEFENIFNGDEDERSNAIYIQLEVCEHVVEFNDMTEWLSISGGIQMKKCPKCNACIRKTKLFISGFDDIELVKKRLYDCDNEKEKMRKSFEIKAKFSGLDSRNIDEYLDKYAFNESDAEKKDRYKLRNNLLVKIKQLSIQTENAKSKIELFIIQSKLCLLREILSIIDDFDYHNEEFSLTCIYVRIAKFLNYIDTIVNNEQQITDMKNEINFFHFSHALSKIASDMRWFSEESKSKLVSAFKLLFSSEPFTDEKRNGVKELVESVIKRMDETSLSQTYARNPLFVRQIERKFSSVSLEEKNISIKLMSFRSGDWFKCSNGHVYCIGESGGQCPLCCEAVTSDDINQAMISSETESD